MTIDDNAAIVDATIVDDDDPGDVISVAAIAKHVSSVESDPDMPWRLSNRLTRGVETPRRRRRVAGGAYFAFVIARTEAVVPGMMDEGNEADVAAVAIAGFADAAPSGAAISFEVEMHMVFN